MQQGREPSAHSGRFAVSARLNLSLFALSPSAGRGWGSGQSPGAGRYRGRLLFGLRPAGRPTCSGRGGFSEKRSSGTGRSALYSQA